MRPMWEAWFCHIEVTNVCWKDCLYCSRYNRHIRQDQRFFMDLDFIAEAAKSLKGYPGRIGIIGGEPTTHPKFEEICILLQGLYPRSRLGLWTTGGARYEKYKSLISKTFGFLAYNEHTAEQRAVCLHQPLTMAIGDLVPDSDLQAELINNCWVQHGWCPSINPKGGFFCEIAQALDVILDGPGGYPITSDWWKKTPEQFKDQVDRYCQYCGMPVPLRREILDTQREKITGGLLEVFRQHRLPKLSTEYVFRVDGYLDREEIKTNRQGWFPSNYRQDLGEA